MSDVKITVRQNGPYLVKGPIDLVDADGNAFRVRRSRWVGGALLPVGYPARVELGCARRHAWRPVQQRAVRSAS